MAFVVAEPCINCKYTDCVAVCPVECFWQDEKMLYIDPQDCIDCEACVPECPVEAIYAEANTPAQWTSYIQLNSEKCVVLKDSGHIAGVSTLAGMYPDADLFCLFAREQSVPNELKGRTLTCSFMQKIPAIARLYRPLLPLFPFAVESLDLRGYDVIISSDASLMKGVLIDQDALHICYCHTPVRYVWDLYWTFRRQTSWLTRPIFTWGRKVMPEMSDTEREALEAGDVWWDADLFTGNPDWSKLLGHPPATLTPEEAGFLNGPVDELCAMLDDWKINWEWRDLSPEAWDFIKQKKFFGMIIPKEYGGLGFSPYAH